MDAALAREFYRFAANPSLGCALRKRRRLGRNRGRTEVDEPCRGATGVVVALGAGQLGYAERSVPRSRPSTRRPKAAVYYQLRDGVAGTCPAERTRLDLNRTGTEPMQLDRT